MTGGPAAHAAGPPAVLIVLVVDVVLVAGVAYLTGAARLRRRGDHWPAVRTAATAAGLAVLAAAALVPVTGFPAEVARHLLTTTAAPILLALGAPVTLALRTLPVTPRAVLLGALRSRYARLVTTAPVVLVVAAGGTYAYYLTPLYAAAHPRPWLPALVHVHMFLAGCLLVWYAAGRDPLPHRPRTSTVLVVLVLATAAHDVLAKLMYAHTLPAAAGTPDEVRLGAQLMFYGGDAGTAVLAVAVLTQWYARSGRELARARRPKGSRVVAADQPS